MKKSLSAPNLVVLGGNVCPAALPLRRRSISTNVLPALAMDMVTDAIKHEWQVESVFKVSAAQAGACGVSLQTFPYEIIDKPSGFEQEKVKDMALCLAAPQEKEEPSMQKVFRAISNASYLEMTEINERILKRYALLLQCVRRNRKSASAKGPILPPPPQQPKLFA